MKSSRHLPGVAVGDKVSGLGPGEVARILDRTGIGPAGTGHVEGVDRIRDPVGHKGVPGHIEVDRSLVDPLGDSSPAGVEESDPEEGSGLGLADHSNRRCYQCTGSAGDLRNAT